jgi:Ricin-type beta-trefoil lectin domain
VKKIKGGLWGVSSCLIMTTSCLANVSEQSEGIAQTTQAWEAESYTNENASTHLFIVNRAVGLLNHPLSDFRARSIGRLLDTPACRQRWQEGLLEADTISKYNNYNGFYGTWKSHFFDPESGKNYSWDSASLPSHSLPTARTSAATHVAQASARFRQSDLEQGCYELGLAMHYFTDLTQPMHAANFSALDAPIRLHSHYEAYAQNVQGSLVIAPQRQFSATLPPDIVLFETAQASRNRWHNALWPAFRQAYSEKCSSIDQYSNDDTSCWQTSTQIEQLTGNILSDAVTATARYLYAIAGQYGALNGLLRGVGGKCLDVQDANGNPGASVQLWSCHGNSNQQWRLQDDGTLRGLADLCLAVGSALPGGGASVSLQSCVSGATTQQWTLTAEGQLRSPSGSCVDVSNGNSSDGTPIIAWPCRSAAANQQWTVLPMPDTRGPIRAVGSLGGRCIDVSGGSTANGTAVTLWQCNSGENQQWQLFGDGTIRGIGGRCLDVPGGATTNGTAVNLWDCNGGENQRWSFTVDGQLKGIGGKCLDIAGGNGNNGTSLVLWDCNGGENQRWSVPSAPFCFDSIAALNDPCGTAGRRACAVTIASECTSACFSGAHYDAASARCQFEVPPGRCDDGNYYTLGPCGRAGERACAAMGSCSSACLPGHHYDASSAHCQGDVASGRCDDGSYYTLGPCGRAGERACALAGTCSSSCLPGFHFDAGSARCQSN